MHKRYWYPDCDCSLYSDGSPRNALFVSEQLDDYRTVIKYCRQQNGIFDPQRVILWGFSFSGDYHDGWHRHIINSLHHRRSHRHAGGRGAYRPYTTDIISAFASDAASILSCSITWTYSQESRLAPMLEIYPFLSNGAFHISSGSSLESSTLSSKASDLHLFMYPHQLFQDKSVN